MSPLETLLSVKILGPVLFGPALALLALHAVGLSIRRDDDRAMHAGDWALIYISLVLFSVAFSGVIVLLIHTGR